jgi:hypothetical protein
MTDTKRTINTSSPTPPPSLYYVNVIPAPGASTTTTTTATARRTTTTGLSSSFSFGSGSSISISPLSASSGAAAEAIASSLHALVVGDGVVLLPRRHYSNNERARRIRLRLTLDMASLLGVELALTSQTNLQPAIDIPLADIQRVCSFGLII